MVNGNGMYVWDVEFVYSRLFSKTYPKELQIHENQISQKWEGGGGKNVVNKT